MLSERYTEIWGLCFEGGEERTYDLRPKVAQLEQRIEAWREAYLALRAYYSNNNGENSRRKRAATDKLKDMKLK